MQYVHMLVTNNSYELLSEHYDTYMMMAHVYIRLFAGTKFSKISDLPVKIKILNISILILRR